MADPVNIRAIVPRVKRAIEPAQLGTPLTDDQLRDVTADAIADVILYTRGGFGHQLLVLETEGDPPIPTEYGTEIALTFPEQSVVAAQAALGYFIRVIPSLKTSESISDEAQSWSYQISSGALTAQIKALIDDRDRALDAIADSGVGVEGYISFIQVRDRHVSRVIEPWVLGHGGSGQELLPAWH